jgi:regulator of RNase E activity RraA
MHVAKEMPPQVDPELLGLLAQCRSESIGHHRHWGFVHGSIKSVIPGKVVVGTAVTLALPGHDSGMLSYALSHLRPGDFLCIDRLGDNHNSCWGGGTTLAAQLAGAVGVVIDGPSTGSSRFEEFGLPAWVRGYSPITCQMLGTGGAMNVPICVGGAAILPGYAILADDSGVLALPPEDVGYLARLAIDRQKGYPAGHARLRAGEKQAHMTGMTGKVVAGLAAEDELREKYGA